MGMDSKSSPRKFLISGKINIRFSFFTALLFLSNFAFAKTSGVTFDSDELTCKIVSLIRAHGDARLFENRVSHAETARQFMSDEATNAIGGNFFYQVVNYRISKSLSFHSIGLLPPLSPAEEQPDPLERNAWSGLLNLYSESSHPLLDLVGKSDMNSLRSLIDLRSTLPSFFIPDGPQQKIFFHRFDVLSQPFVSWLLTKQIHQLSAIELVSQVTEQNNGDVLTALGLIGQSFHYERMYVTSAGVESRAKLALLGSRIKPLYEPSKNPIGVNYHFWAYLNMGLQGPLTEERIFSIAYEKWAEDKDEFVIDNLGMTIGLRVRRIILENKSCPFYDPIVFHYGP